MLTVIYNNRMRTKAQPTVITGKVIRYSRKTTGLFTNVILEGQKQFVTINISDELTYPEPGQTIKVTGIVNPEGRFLTMYWEYA